MPKNIIYAGGDDGFAETKIWLSNGIRLKIPSHIRTGFSNQIAVSAGTKSVIDYMTEDGPFHAGLISKPDAIAFDDYPISAANRVLVSHAIQAALKEGGCETPSGLYLCSGLPVKKFYKMGRLNDDLILRKENNLLKNDVIADGKVVIPLIAGHKVLAEGVAAYMDYIIVRGPDGKLIVDPARAQERVAVVDIGGRTTDIAVVVDGNLDLQRSSTIESGMLDIYEQAKERLYDEFGEEPLEADVRRTVESKKFRIWGEDKHVGHLVADAIQPVIGQIKAECRRRLGRASDLDKVLFVGGTVEEVRKWLDGWFPNQLIASYPSFSNASGMCKYAEMYFSHKD